MYRYTRNILVLLTSLAVYSQGYTATCSIESGPPPLLSAYIREARSAAQELTTRYRDNLCSRDISPVTILNQSLSTLDKAGNQVPVMNNIITDFTYNVMSIYRLDIPPMVLSQGELLYTLEKNILIPTLDTLAARCQLNGRAEGEIIALIQRNNHIQDVFKGVTTGTLGVSSDPLEKEILDNYSSEALSNCQSSTDMSISIDKITDKTEGFGSDITIAMNNWRSSMALLRGDSRGTQENYMELQRRLLQGELSRQGLSQGATKQMMSNLTCIQKEATKDTIEEWTRARARCIGNPLIGYAELASAYEDLKFGVNRLTAGTKKFFNGTPQDTNEYIALTVKVDNTIQEERSIITVYSEMESAALSLGDEEATTNTIITNLVDIHTSLEAMNRLLEKRIPKIQADCMKGNPGVTGACITE